MEKRLLVILMLVICGSAFLARLNFGNGYEMSYSQIISEDTTWTKANSPINLPGNVLVGEGATLTIEAGVTVNCAKHVIQVNGTLKVQGSDQDKVIFTSTNTQISSAREQLANINFGDHSLGNVIENAIFHTMAWTYYNCNNSITIDHVIIQDGATAFVSVLPTIRGSGTAIITNSVFTSGFQLAISSTVINNTFSDAGISASYGSFIIANNTITGTKSGVQGYGVSIEDFQKAVISDNQISNYAEACIRVYDGPALIQRNYLESEPNMAGYPFFGILVDGSSPIIQNNTITNTGIGICLRDSGVILAKPTIRNNNIHGNEVWNLFLGYPERPGYNTLDYAAVSSIDAANNWWGATDNGAISQLIRDSKYRSDLGTVTFFPFLTGQNPQATPNPNAPTPTLEQAPAAEVIQATKDQGQKIELILNGNLTIMWNSQVNVTANLLTSSTNVTFTVRADEPNTDFGNITIPKTAIPYGNKPTVYLDNEKAQDQGYAEDADNYYVWCTTHLSGYFYGPLTIVFASPSPSPSNTPDYTPYLVAVVVIVAAFGVGLLVYFRKRNH